MLFLEVIYSTILVEFYLRFLPYKKTKELCSLNINTSQFNTTKVDIKFLVSLKEKLKTINRVIPAFNCYNQALTARLILTKRAYRTTLLIGFKMDANEELKGHAWLKCENKTITGGVRRKLYKVSYSYH